jgi:hypothetical protein
VALVTAIISTNARLRKDCGARRIKFREVLPNRINIDTGAFATGRLTCLVIDHDQRRFLSTE